MKNYIIHDEWKIIEEGFHKEENRITEARSAGADVILNKPFTADQLLASVKQLLA